MSGRNISKQSILNIRYELLICLFLIITILAVYLQVRNHNFVKLDDTLYITDNKKVQNGLTKDSIIWAFTTDYAAYWMPLTWLSHMMDCHIYGMNPGHHHLTNVLYHILNTILLFFLFKRMTGKLWQSSFVAALFALHPLHVESVAWIAERKDVLSTFFLFMTLWTYTRYVENFRVTDYLLSFLFFTLGLMAKPMIVTLPFLLLLLDYWPLERLRLFSNSFKVEKAGNTHVKLSKLIWEKVPFFLFAAGSSIVTFLLHLQDGSVASLSTLPFGSRVANALVSYASYIIKMFFPYDLAVLYPYQTKLPLWQIIGSGVLIVIISYLAIRAAKSKPYIITGWLWYVGTLVPVIGLLHAGLHARADRFTYIPLIGLFIMIAWGTPELLKKWKNQKTGIVVISAAMLLFFSVNSWIQTGYWSDSITLFKHTLGITSDNYLISHNLNVALREAGPHAEADKYYYDALKIRFDSKEEYRNISGIALITQGRYDEAIDIFNNILMEKPDSVNALINIGNALAAKGRLDEAIKRYLRALEIDSDSAEACNNLGLVFMRKGKIEDAITLFRDTLRYEPGNKDADRNLSKALSDINQIEKAVEGMRKALKIDPEESMLQKKIDTLNNSKINLENIIYQFYKSLSTQPGFKESDVRNLEKVNKVKKEYEKKFPVFKKIIEFKPGIADAYYHVACIYAIQNKNEKSIKWLKKAVEKGFNNWELLRVDKDLENISKSKFLYFQ